MENQRSVRWDVAAVVMFAAAALLWLSLLTHDAADDLGDFSGPIASVYTPMNAAYPPNAKIQNSCGYIGALVSDILMQATGIGSYLVAMLVMSIGRCHAQAATLGIADGTKYWLDAHLGRRLLHANVVSASLQEFPFRSARAVTWVHYATHGWTIIWPTWGLPFSF